ncbi:MAG: hypothetical protein BroJett030_07050 [Alphaproteobacteria bacterium]|nr:MAG: hypothetical protein BroJett030_07050 [Alphaproteobacteria bacterium]
MSTIDTFHKSLSGTSGMAGASAFAYRVLVAVETFLNRWTLAAEKRRTRRTLALLSDHQLRDIGVTRHQAEREANRAFWY